MKGVVIFLADGFEDMEALATRDVLVRGGIDVRTVSITEDPTVVSSHGVSLWADMTYDEYCDEAGDGPAVREDVMVFPGGMPGSRHLAEHADLVDRMKRHYQRHGGRGRHRRRHLRRARARPLAAGPPPGRPFHLFRGLPGADAGKGRRL